MYRQPYLKVIEEVLTWDLPDIALTDAIQQQVLHSINIDDGYDWENYPIAPTINH